MQCHGSSGSVWNNGMWQIGVWKMKISSLQSVQGEGPKCCDSPQCSPARQIEENPQNLWTIQWGCEGHCENKKELNVILISSLV